jgi:hypothetical protein
VAVVLVVVLALAARTPLIAGYRDLGVVDAVPASHGLGIDPGFVSSESDAETDAIWRSLVNTLWDSPDPIPARPDVDYDQEILVLATYFGSSSCAPSLEGVEFRGGTANVQINPFSGFGGCSADAVPYTFAVAISRDRLPAGPADIRMTPTARPQP